VGQRSMRLPTILHVGTLGRSQPRSKQSMASQRRAMCDKLAGTRDGVTPSVPGAEQNTCVSTRCPSSEGSESMCVLCGEALTHIHWTDQRADERTTVSMFVGDDQQRSRMRDRLHFV